MFRLFVIAALLNCACLPLSVPACTTFCVENAGTLVFGKNYDWSADAGLFVVNKRGVAKQSDPTTDGGRTISWTSRFGSTTFNQFGREFPSGGMNEAGLVIELLWLNETKYPAPDDRPSVSLLTWIQYQLDTKKSVAELLASDTEIRITDHSSGRCHFLVADASGAVAAVEFLEGALVAHTGEDLVAPVLANDRYDRSAKYLGQHRGFGGSRRPMKTAASLDRFVRGADSWRHEVRDPVEHAFATLAEVSQGSRTKWSIVYDIHDRVVHYRTYRSSARKHFAFSDADFSCDTPVRFLDLNADVAGDLNEHLVPYDPALNLSIITDACRNISFLKHLEPAVLREWSDLGQMTSCVQ
ncbi:MAG: linear amide C-N hydrolase [Gemmatimonadetes bacterium]|nr:linear amide C-N hydrolase [Gemmatimonadota bacterium]